MEEKRFSVRLGLGSVLGIVFLILKLVGVISWSWLWVLAPFWIPLGLVILLTLFIGVLTVFDSY